MTEIQEVTTMPVYTRNDGIADVITSPGAGGRRHAGITDGTSNTFMIGEALPNHLEGHECLVFYLGGIPGLSPGGADEFMNGRVISDPKDRRILADTLLKDLGFTTLVGESSMHMLLPAVQAARQATRNQGWGPWEINLSSRVSVPGALQFLSGDPVSDPKDRSNVFAVWLTIGHFTESDRSSYYNWTYQVRRPRL